MSFHSYVAPLRRCGRNLLFVFLALIIPISIYPHSPRKDLLPVRSPDLTNLEESVREQVTELQNALAATAKNPKTADTELSEAYGKLGQIYHAYSLISPARDCYVNASLLAPKDFRWLYLLARLDQQLWNAVRDGTVDGYLKQFPGDTVRAPR